MRSLFFEIIESGGMGGGGTTGRIEVSARVGFAQMLLGELGEGGGLIIAITDDLFARR